MAAVTIQSVLVVLMVVVGAIGEASAVNRVSANINAACQASQFPEACVSSLMNTPLANKRGGGGAREIVRTAMGLSSDGVKQSYRLSESILGGSSHDFNSTVAARNCLEALGASMRTISRSAGTDLGERGGGVKDAMAWMSAALTYQYDCYSALNRLNRSDLGATIHHMNSTMSLTSTALGMVAALDTYGRDIKSWRPPQTERSANYSTSKTFGSAEEEENILGVNKHGSSNLLPVPNATVSQDEEHNTSEYSSIQAAVEGAPDYSARLFIIHIKAGVYREIVRVPPSKTNLMFVGDGMDRTIITGSMNAAQPGVGTYGSATVGVNADGFVARDVTFENSAGPEMRQAVALRVDSDLSAFHRCAVVGHQDTLYAHTLRQFYSNCRIEGTVDFIFGNAAAVFSNTTLLIRPHMLPSTNGTGESSPIAAHGRLDPGQSTGFVFDNCFINGTEQYMRDFYANPKIHKAYLGRPWKLYSTTVVMRSYIGEVITAEGWLPWDAAFALDTLFFGEFHNYGPSSASNASATARVPWSTQISPLTALHIYSLQAFIQAHRWLPFLLSNYLFN